MPVAGLPAAVEALLSSLLSTEVFSSWKCVGEPGSSVVVLRFRQAGGQPCLANCNERGTWRRKTPSQQRRDQERAERHRATGEQQPFRNASSQRAESEHDANFVHSHDAATSRASTSQVSPTRLTFDPAGRHTNLATADADSNPIQATAAGPQSSTVSSADTDTTTVLPPPTTEDGITDEDLQDVLERMLEVSASFSKLREETAIATAPQPCQDEDEEPQPQRSRFPVKSAISESGDRVDRGRHSDASPADDPVPDPRRRLSRRQAREDDNAGQRRGRNLHAATKPPTARSLRTSRR